MSCTQYYKIKDGAAQPLEELDTPQLLEGEDGSSYQAQPKSTVLIEGEGDQESKGRYWENGVDESDILDEEFASQKAPPLDSTYNTSTEGGVFDEDAKPLEKHEFIQADDPEKRFKGSGRANKYFKYKGDPLEREIDCYECYNKHSIIKSANSSLCPNCGTYISLKDYTIENFWTSSIRTRGDVVIHKKGIVKNVTVFCNDLTIDGTFHATADCSGEMLIKSSGIISGSVNCNRLLIDKGANVVFEKSVSASEVIILGSARAKMKVDQQTIIHTSAVLDGAIETSSLFLHRGGKVIGDMKVG